MNGLICTVALRRMPICLYDHIINIDILHSPSVFRNIDGDSVNIS